MTKPATIQAIEAYYQIEIPQLASSELSSASLWRTTGFVLNQQQQVIAISIYDKGIKELTPLLALTHLQQLFVVGNKLTTLQGLSNLQQLQQLDCSDNQLTSLQDISNLQQLQKVNCSSNQLISLQDISNLQQLQELYCGDNQLTSLEEALSNLQQLQKVNCSFNKLTSLQDISNLPQLQQLDCRYNQLTSLQDISNLQQLQHLNCDDNQLTSLQDISNLPQLQQLYCSRNQLTSLEGLSNLQQLQRLDCSHNIITDINPLEPLKNIKRLDILNNKVSELPVFILDLEMSFHDEYQLFKDGFYYSDNPWQNPPIEIISQGKEAIVAYFKANQQSEPLNEAKLIFLGDGAVGKTTLMKALLGKPTDRNEPQTQGVNLEKLPINTSDQRQIKVNLWDFGGQEAMHPGHAFFLTQRTFYLVVIDRRKEQNVEYWMEHIQSLAGVDAPVLIVATKLDKLPTTEQPSLTKEKPIDTAIFDHFSRNELQEKYPNIQGFFHISSTERWYIDELTASITQHIEQLETVSFPFPKKWKNVKQQIEQRTSANQPTLSREAYNQICQDNHLEATDNKILLKLLNDIGTITCFEIKNAQGLQILNPEWLTDGVYTIMTDMLAKQKKGELIYPKDFKAMFKDKVKSQFTYEDDKIDIFLSLMTAEKYQLAYNLPPNSNYFIPTLFPKDQPAGIQNDYESTEALRLKFEYTGWLPLGIICRFIVIEFANKLQYWQKGIELQHPTSEDTQALVRMHNTDQHTGYIEIITTGALKSEWANILAHSLKVAHATYPNLKYQELLQSPDGKEYIPLKRIINVMKFGEKKVQGDKNIYSINKLLGHYNYQEYANEQVMITLLKEIRQNQNQHDQQFAIILNLVQQLAETTTPTEKRNLKQQLKDQVDQLGETGLASLRQLAVNKGFEGAEQVIELIKNMIT